MPKLGEHNDEVLRTLGIDDAELDSLRARLPADGGRILGFTAIGLVLAVLLTAYLVAALIVPEKF